jgi:hypothetical protein
MHKRETIAHGHGHGHGHRYAHTWWSTCSDQLSGSGATSPSSAIHSKSYCKTHCGRADCARLSGSHSCGERSAAPRSPTFARAL